MAIWEGIAGLSTAISMVEGWNKDMHFFDVKHMFVSPPQEMPALPYLAASRIRRMSNVKLMAAIAMFPK